MLSRKRLERQTCEAGMAALEAIVPSFVLADERTMQLLLASLCLVAALLVAAAVIALVNRWRRQRDAKEDISPNAELSHYRSLYEAGTISQEEFERLRAVLSARMRESLGVSPPPPAPPPPPPETGIQRPDGPDTGIRPA
jgi:hypothetical protein